MTTLAVDTPRDYELGDLNDLPIIANDIVYEGAACGDNGSGYIRPLVAGDPFRGFCYENCDNTGGSAGDKRVRLKQKGRVKLSVSGAAITDVGKEVYASDDAAFTLTATSNSRVGRIVRWVSTGVVIVEFDASSGGIGTFTALTDNSGGTASDTLAAISGTYVQSEIRNSIASLAAKINNIEQRLR